MFIEEKKYSREEIFKSYFPAEEFPKWGQWRTGYIEIKESNELVVFMNIGVPSNTSGEEWDFNNSYNEETKTITWYGKPDRKFDSKQSQKILSGGLVLRFFARWDNKAKFTYLGIGNVVDYEKEFPTKKGDGTPAKSWEATVLLQKPDDKWADEELEAAVEAYRRMQWLVAAHIPFSKTAIFDHYNEETLSKRSRSSFERRMMNISHVIETSNSKRNGLSLAEHGYKPLRNVGTNVEKTLQVLLNESSTKEYVALQICKRLGIDTNLVTGMEQVGSTINKDFYETICEHLEIEQGKTKQECVESILRNQGIKFEPEECFSKG